MSSEVENRAAGETARWTGRPEAERRGQERITSLDISRSDQRFLDFARNDRRENTTQCLFSSLDVHDDHTPHSAAMNMAIDEALLEYATIPLIRFYRWWSSALSFGYFGRFTDIARYQCERDLVRRWTGGGIVFHGEDLTYSLVIPTSDMAFAESSMSIYEKTHRALCDTLRETGERAVVAGVADSDPGSATVATRTGISDAGYSCFANPARADVMIDGRKIAGAAQRRTRRGLLQQGSIQGIGLQRDLAQRFARKLSIDRSERKADEKILNRARELAEQKYGTESWLRKR
jgi:lipoyl(octanoyl) transferase